MTDIYFDIHDAKAIISKLAGMVLHMAAHEGDPTGSEDLTEAEKAIVQACLLDQVAVVGAESDQRGRD